ncbi:hypothetical protein MIMGU_mgv1a024501mg [Erythranthe guttata]|uniref:Uncharacterized protein n=1 Tax=Erythranthe guttata TaxID=4155 RepID=A0A022QQA9_ERYGU|nr:hypothetical protein MIMGU_mgv1a024501mg [Erythranthe guttata]
MADMMLDVYILDYFVKRKLHNSAYAFMSCSFGKYAPGGFLLEWWFIFWDITRTNEKHSEPAAAYIQREQQQQQQLLMQQLQQMQQHPPLGDPMNSEGMMKMVENQRVSELPLEGFTFNSLLPLTGIDQIGTISGLQNPNLLTQNQFLLASQQQQATHADHKTETSKGEVGRIREKNKVTCCHFSSNGKLLASAGLDKKAVLWNMDTLQTHTTVEEHQDSITDVRFQPNSTQIATASFDKSVRIWDVVHQEGGGQVRFEPITGKLLASASDKVVSIVDVETDKPTHSFHGHFGVVNNICWDINGDHLASVSEDCVKIWRAHS